MDYYAIYLGVCLLVKLVFVYFVIKTHVAPTPNDFKLLHQTENLFTILMSLLLVYLFHPGHKTDVKIDRETKLFLFLFGLLMFIDMVKVREATVKKEQSHA